jgi:tRNA(fMet)-specific endonuclease VapC
VLVLDTDTLTIWLNPDDALHDRLRRRLDLPDAGEYTTTAVNLQEQVVGWLADINRARRPEEIVRGYRNLLKTFEELCDLDLLPYDEAAHNRFAALRPQLRRLGTIDLRIACVVLVNNATLLTRNVRDFRQVPGLAFEDWSR